MKRTLHLFYVMAALMATLTAAAQPTITGSGVNYVIGTSFTNNTCDYISEGNAGANQTWDFSSMNVTGNIQISIEQPSNTAQSSSFPNANIAWVTSGSSGEVAYYNASSSSLQFYGIHVPGSATIPYNDPENQLQFPITYNDTYSDTWDAVFTASGITYHREGTTTVTADGYGTLITPAGTYNNTLRIHIKQIYQDSANIAGTPYVINYDVDTYSWYKEGYKSYLASIYTLSSTHGPQSSASYISNLPVSMNEITRDASCKVFPNPASEKVNIELSTTGNVNVKLINASGHQVKTTAFVKGQNLQLDVSALPEGLYFARIVQGETNLVTKKIVVKH